LTGPTPVCDGDGVQVNRPDGLPDGSLGIAAAVVACAAGATLAIEVGFDAGDSVLVALAGALLLSILIKIGVDMHVAGILQAIAAGDLEADAAPGRIQARLASRQHRETLGQALRKIADDARRYPWQGRLAAPPIILHFQPATCRQLVRLAEVLEAPRPLEPRGVAVVEDLVTNPASPLFGSSDDDVEVEVRRALFLLGVD
jgi:hypothetical protein